MRRALVALAALAIAAPTAAQERVQEATLPADVAAEVVAFFNDLSTVRFNGRSRIPAGRAVEGDVAVLGGPFLVAGEIRGRLVVVNGDLTILEGARILGDVTIIGGQVRAAPEGSVSGTLTVYSQRLSYATHGGELVLRGGPRTERRGIFVGNSRLTVRAGTAYNRIEGLPVLFGPVLQTSGRDRLRLEALAAWRTETGSTRDDLGYDIRLEQRIGLPWMFVLGARAYSEVSPIESWGLSDLEASFATFFLHKDYRDYFERQGFSVVAGTRVPATGLEVQLQYRNEEHLNLSVASPWTLRRNDKPWRPLPLVAHGDVQTLTLSAVLDRRNDPRHPTDGWYARGHLTRGIGGDLERAAYNDPVAEQDVEASAVPIGFTTGFLDLRRYARIGPDEDLTFRGVFAGSVDGDAVPAQFQYALGGEGSIPGIGLFRGDCGARASVVTVRGRAEDKPTEEEAFARYGCDRIALFQVEYRHSLPLHFGLAPKNEEEWERRDWYPAIDFSPAWSVFFDAGRGWSRTLDAPNTGTMADLGASLHLGDLAFSWAFPLTGSAKRLNFFVRLQRRF